VASLTVNSAMRPLRAIVFVPAVDGLEWQYTFVGALRAQTRVWGGQSNLPVPLDDATFEHPALWGLLRALDPDAVIIHWTRWADLEDLKPERYTEYRDETEAQLRRDGLGEEAIARFLDELRDQRLTDRSLTSDEERRLLQRAPFLHHDGHLESGYAGGLDGPGYPFVDALKLRLDFLPDPIAGLACPFSADGQLGLAADGGQFSPAVEREVSKRRLVVGDTHEVSSESELARRLHVVAQPPGPAFPFALAEAGLTWYSQRGPRDDTTVRLVVGDDPWDFSIFYALRRLTGAAYWVPSNRVDDELWVHELAQLRDRFRLGRLGRLQVCSVSDPDLATELAQRIGEVTDPSEVQVVGWESLLPVLPRRQLRTGSPSFPETLALEEGQRSSGLFPTPVPDIRGQQDPFDMHWIVDLHVERWNCIPRSGVGPAVLDAPGYGSYSVRATTDGVAYLNPRPLVTATEHLESQVVRPRLRPLSTLAQLEALLAGGGWRCALSDKGIYRDQTADLLGGLEELVALVANAKWHRLLLALTSTKKSGQPGRWLKSEQRRVFRLNDLDALLAQLGLTESTVDLVSRGLVRRGLLHKCPRCRWEGWYEQDELGGDLRCGRCRRPFRLGDSGWFGQGEPSWFYRSDEVVWQFCEHHGQLPLRAAWDLLWTDRPTTVVAPEVDLFEPGMPKPIELDLCVVRGAEFWIGEAKTTATLGKNESDALRKMRRLRRAAEAVGADGVLLVSEIGFGATAQAVIRDVFPEKDRFQVRVECCPEPSEGEGE
jgi:hypothetical protein